MNRLDLIKEFEKAGYERRIIPMKNSVVVDFVAPKQSHKVRFVNWRRTVIYLPILGEVTKRMAGWRVVDLDDKVLTLAQVRTAVKAVA